MDISYARLMVEVTKTSERVSAQFEQQELRATTDRRPAFQLRRLWQHFRPVRGAATITAGITSR